MLPASLRTGTTTLTAGVLAWFMICCARSLATFHGACPCQRAGIHFAGTCAALVSGASFLWGDEAAGNPLDARPGGTRQRMRGTLGIHHEAEVAPRKPVAH